MRALAVIGEKTEAVAPQWAGLWGEAGVLGSVLAEDVRMGEASPRFDRALLDGFALLSGDGKVGAELEVVGRVDAGGAGFGGRVLAGQCVGINTGGILPAGADAVLMVEFSELFERGGGSWMRVKKAVATENGVQRKGTEAAAGTVVVQAGRQMGPGQIAACAAAGVGRVLVRRVRVGILTTGDELVDPGEGAGGGIAGQLAEGKIWNSNRPMLLALVRQTVGSGGGAADLGKCPDAPAETDRVLAEGLSACDLVVVCGGMSMGTRDWAPEILRKLGVEMHIEKVRMKPGKPFLFGSVAARAADDSVGTDGGGGKEFVAGVPGNPVSAFVTYHRFVREIIGRLAGAKEPGLVWVEAESETAIEANGDRDFYVPCVFSRRGATLVARALSWKGSGNAVMLARAQGLMLRPAGAAVAVAGAMVGVASL